MEQLMSIKEQLISAVQGQMNDLSSVNAKELGEVVDMIKDISETMYYCAVTDAMNNSSEEEKEYYMGKYMKDYWHDPRMDEPYRSRMYYTPVSHTGYEGRSPMIRKMFMETKDINDKASNQKELEHYITELGEDITEMIQGLAPEDKNIVKTKLTQLAARIV